MVADESYMGGLGHSGGLVWLVRDVVPPLRQELSHRSDPGDQGDDPDGSEAGRPHLMKLFKRAGSVPGLLASFVHIDAAVDAIRALRAMGQRNVVVYSPAPNHELEEALN